MVDIRLTESQRLIVKLEKLTSKLSEEDAPKALSLRAWFIKTGALTKPQRWLAKMIIRRIDRARMVDSVRIAAKKGDRFWLYAVSDGESVKLGFSSNIENRIKGLQTSHPAPLSELWRLYVGRDRRDAWRLEQALHRHCKAHKKGGEWFDIRCMDLVRAFSP